MGTPLLKSSFSAPWFGALLPPSTELNRQGHGDGHDFQAYQPG